MILLSTAWQAMFINPDRFQPIILNKKKFELTKNQVLTDNQQIQTVSYLEHLGIQLDNKLHFNYHINNIFRSTQTN